MAAEDQSSERRYGHKTVDERRGDRRGRLMAAGLDAYGAEGGGGTTIEALCAAASVSTRSFYEEFRSQEDLVIALHDDVNLRALEGVVAAIATVGPDDVGARARVATQAYLDVMTSDRRWARVALVESVGIGPTGEAHRRKAIDGFVALIEAEASRLAGQGVIPRRDFHLTAVALAGAVNGLINTWTAESDWDERVQEIGDEAARIIALALEG